MKTVGSYFLVILLNIFVIQEVHSECSESTNWMRELTLDDKGQMIIKWNFTNDILTMMMIGRTKGYISVGFAPTKKMKEADIIVGWIQNGKPYLQDRYSLNGEEPVVDTKQSLLLLGGEENNTHTSLCFQRSLNTCDGQDFSIQNGTVMIFWALSTNDPINTSGILQYLSTNRGVTPVYLLAIIYPKPTNKDLEYFDISPRKNVAIKGDANKSDDTLYWCTNYKYPPFDTERFLLGFEILIPPQSKDVVHHLLLYLCKPEAASKVYDKLDPNGYDCINSEYSKYRNPCNFLQAIWAEGVNNLYFPEKLGIPFESTSENFYLKVELHYRIRKDQKAITDNSTIRLLLTKQRPQFEGGITNTGSQISPIFLIPPKQKAYSALAICGGSCLQQTFPKDGFINIVAMRYHSHLTGRKIRVHIFRNNNKITTLSDEHMDFQFQGFRFLAQEVKVLSTDILVTECVYDTSDRNKTTIGSNPLEQEMCAANFLYYPRIQLNWCMSFPDRKQIFNLTGIEEVKNYTESKGCKDHECVSIHIYPGIEPTDIIVKPPEFANQTLQQHMTNFNNWTQQRIEQLTAIYYLPQTPVCIADFASINIKNLVPLEFPANTKNSLEPPNPCSN